MGEATRRPERARHDKDIERALERYVEEGSDPQLPPAEAFADTLIRLEIWLRFRRIVEDGSDPATLRKADENALSEVIEACKLTAEASVPRRGLTSGGLLRSEIQSMRQALFLKLLEYVELECEAECASPGTERFGLAGRMSKAEFYNPALGSLKTWIGQPWFVGRVAREDAPPVGDAARRQTALELGDPDDEDRPSRIDLMSADPVNDLEALIVGDSGLDEDTTDELGSEDDKRERRHQRVREALLAELHAASDFAVRKYYVSNRERHAVVTELLDGTPGHQGFAEGLLKDLRADDAGAEDQPHMGPCELKKEAAKSRFLAAQARLLLAAKHQENHAIRDNGLVPDGERAAGRGWLVDRQDVALLDADRGFLVSTDARRQALCSGKPTYGVNNHVHFGVCNLLIALVVDTRGLGKCLHRIEQAGDGAVDASHRLRLGQSRLTHGERIARCVDLIARDRSIDPAAYEYVPLVVLGPDGLNLHPSDTGTRTQNVLPLLDLVSQFEAVAHIVELYGRLRTAPWLDGAVAALDALGSWAECKDFVRQSGASSELVDRWATALAETEWTNLIKKARETTDDFAWYLTTRRLGRRPQRIPAGAVDPYRDPAAIARVLGQAWMTGLHPGDRDGEVTHASTEDSR